MTVKTRRLRWLSAERLSGVLSVLLFVWLLRRSEAASGYVFDGMRLCARRLVPTLFPFMVISELILSSGALDGAREGSSRGKGAVLGAGTVAVLLGALSGFPVGARASVRLLDEGRISARECERLLTVTSFPSLAFTVAFVGESLFSSRAVGLALWCVTVLCTLLSGALASRLFALRREDSNKSPFSARRRRGIAELFTDAVSTSALSTLYVCGYVIFFSALVGTLGDALTSFGVSETVSAAICSLFEISTGVSRAAELCGAAGHTICALALGWSGISVHCQIATVSAGRGLDLTPYLLSKALSGVLCAAVVTLLRAAVKT